MGILFPTTRPSLLPDSVATSSCLLQTVLPHWPVYEVAYLLLDSQRVSDRPNWRWQCIAMLLPFQLQQAYISTLSYIHSL
jgi:hypothetical protein